MFRLAVILVHLLIFLVAIIIGLAGKFNPASSESGENYVVWFSAFALFNILVFVSAFVQLRVRKVWVFLMSVIGLIVLFILTLQYIYPYVLDLL